MLKCEIVLIDPSPGEIAERLADAAADANRRCRTRLVADDPAKWRKFARQTQAVPEGFELWRGGKGGVPATQLVGAWWTDHIGRKHVVIRGRRIEHDGAKPLLDKFELSRRPPLWHCYPERLVQRWLQRENDLPQVDWIAVCGCGAMGTPEALGWMGATCGPCHDRREEGSAPHVRPGSLPPVRSPITSLAFGRVGAKLAVLERDGVVAIWDLDSPAQPVRIEPNAPDDLVDSVRFYGENDEYVIGPFNDFPDGWLNVCDWRRTPRWELLPNATHAGGAAAAPTADPTCVAVSSSSGLVLLDVPSGRIRSQVELQPYFSLVASAQPAARQLQFANGMGVRIVDSTTFEPIATYMYWQRQNDPELHIPFPVRTVYLESTGTVVVALHSELFHYEPGAMNLSHSISLARVPIAAYQNMPAHIGPMALSIDGRHLYLAVEERLVVLDANSMEPLAAFAWHLGPIRCLAVSTDNRTLATAGNDGIVKLWPMDRLMTSAE